MKKFFFYAAALFMTAVGFTACTAEDEVFPDPVLSITEDATSIGAEGGAITFNLTAPSNERFTIETPDWIEVDDEKTTRGVNTVSDLHFIVAPAESCQERVGVIKITTVSGRTESIEVVQKGVEPAFAVEKASLGFVGGEFSVALTAVDGYTITMPEWIQVLDDVNTTHDDKQTAVLNFVVAQNTEGQRSGEIVVTCGDGCGKSATLVVSQLPQAIQYKGQLTSLAYGDVYDSNVTIIWDDADPTLVYVCDLEPYYASEGRNLANGENILPSYYSAPDGAIVLFSGEPFNIDNYFFLATTSADDQGEPTDYGYLVFNADMSAMMLPYAFYTAYATATGTGADDLYAGNAVYTLVTE